MANWEIVLTHPENKKWHLVSNKVSFGLRHDCFNNNNPMVGTTRMCQYCYTDAPDKLWGMYRLAEWGAE